MEALCCAGVALSGLGVAAARFRCGAVLAPLWCLYRGLYRAGGDFMAFQWDILLLEVGLLALVAAPLLPGRVGLGGVIGKHDPARLSGDHDDKGMLAVNAEVLSTSARAGTGLWVLRWLMFRLMFASGAVKLLWGDKDWWGLSALAAHFQASHRR